MSTQDLQVTFIHGNPKQRARPDLERVLRHGTKRLCLACCFATKAGLKVLRPFLKLLDRPGSFAVFSCEYPTDLTVLGKWLESHPGHIFIHYGKHFRRAESFNTRELMHSKLFYASDGVTAKVWCGSHNLTGSALQGRNIEAATIVEGPEHHPYFQAVLAHLEDCRSRAHEEIREEPDGTSASDYVLELELDDPEEFVKSAVAGKFLQFSPANDRKQDRLTPGMGFFIHLHRRGALKVGKPIPPPAFRIEGRTTGTNLNPNHLVRGTKATFNDIVFTIIEKSDGIHVVETGPKDIDGPISAAIRIIGEVREPLRLLPAKPSDAAELEVMTRLCDTAGIATLDELYTEEESKIDADLADEFKDTRLEARLPYLRKRLWIAKWKLQG